LQTKQYLFRTLKNYDPAVHTPVYLGTGLELSIMKVNLGGHKFHSLANSRYCRRR